MPEQINYKYLGVTVVLIAILILVISSNKIKYEKVHTDEMNKNAIRVYTINGVVKIDPNTLVIKLNKLKIAIVYIQDNMRSISSDTTNGVIFNQHLNNAKNELFRYINMNISDNSLKNYTNEIEQLSIKQLSKKQINFSDGDDADFIIMEGNIHDLENYIDFVILLANSPLSKKGLLNLNTINKLLSIIDTYKKYIILNNSTNYNKSVINDVNMEQTRKEISIESEGFEPSSCKVSECLKFKHSDISHTFVDRTAVDNKHRKLKLTHNKMDRLTNSTSHSINNKFKTNIIKVSKLIPSNNTKMMYDITKKNAQNKSTFVDKNPRSSLAESCS
jgi:hypothetical protein